VVVAAVALDLTLLCLLLSRGAPTNSMRGAASEKKPARTTDKKTLGAKMAAALATEMAAMQ
jgi:hypothetical protein